MYVSRAEVSLYLTDIYGKGMSIIPRLTQMTARATSGAQTKLFASRKGEPSSYVCNLHAKQARVSVERSQSREMQFSAPHKKTAI